MEKSVFSLITFPIFKETEISKNCSIIFTQNTLGGELKLYTLARRTIECIAYSQVRYGVLTPSRFCTKVRTK